MGRDDTTSQARWRALRRVIVGLAAIVAAAMCMVSLTRPPTAGSGPSALLAHLTVSHSDGGPAATGSTTRAANDDAVARRRHP